MLVFIKIILLFCFLILPLIPPKKRKGTGKSVQQIAEDRSAYGVTEDGNIAIMTEEEKKD